MRNRQLLTSRTVARVSVFWNSGLVKISGVELPDAVTLNSARGKQSWELFCARSLLVKSVKVANDENGNNKMPRTTLRNSEETYAF